MYLIFEMGAVSGRRVTPPRSTESLDRLRRRLAHADEGWFFAGIAAQMAERRLELGLSQADLARRCRTSQSAIARLEGGGRPPRIDTLLRLADALDCDLVVELRARDAESLDATTKATSGDDPAGGIDERR